MTDRFEEVVAGWERDQSWRTEPVQRKVIPLRANGHADLSPPPQLPSLVSVCASEVGLQPVKWIWEGRIAKGKHTCIAGEPGTGKSQLSMFITATITIGGVWPSNEGRAPQGSVVILSAEDGAADTIAPRRSRR